MFSFAKKLKDKFEGGAGSGTDSDSYFHTHLARNNTGHGLRVLYVKPDSKAYDAGFESWFDYIVGVNGHGLPMRHVQHTGPSYNIGEDGLFNYGDSAAASLEASMVDFDLLAQEFAMVAHGPEKVIHFEVWSAKGGELRHVLFPLDPIEEKQPQTVSHLHGTFHLYENVFAELGLTVSSQHLNTATHVWRILNTHLHSPAFQAQLAPYSDYIIGCDSAFPTDIEGKGLLAGGGEQRLAKAVSEYYTHHQETLQDDRIPVILYVYNHDFDTVRPVTVYLSRSWAPGHNKGILGCDVGYGLLHRLPAVPGKFESFVAPVSLAPANFSGQKLEEPFVYNDPKPIAINTNPPAQALPVKSKASNRYAPVSKSQTRTQTEIEPQVENAVSQEQDNVSDPKLAASQEAVGKETNTESENLSEVKLSEDKSEMSEIHQKQVVHTLLEKEISEPTAFPNIEGISAEKDMQQNPDEHLETSPAQAESDLQEKPDITDIEKIFTAEKHPEIDDSVPKDLDKSVPAQVELNIGGLSLEELSEPNAPPIILALTEEFTEIPLTSDNRIIESEKEELPLVEDPKHTIDSVPTKESIEEKEPGKTEVHDSTLKPDDLSKIDSLLEEDEDFLDEDLNEPEAEPEQAANMEELQMSKIPLNDPAPIEPLAPPISKPLLSPSRIPPPTQNLVNPVFSSIRPGLPLSPSAAGPPIAKPGRRRKTHGPANLGSLADFMNEELSKSKANDQNYNCTSMENVTDGVPPPPPKSVRR